MTKIISVNAGSSSLKFQLFEMPEETVLTSGIVEKIGFEDAIFTIKVNGEKVKKVLPIPDHTKAVSLLLEALVEYKIVESLDEIKGAGHRAVHGGEIFKESVPVTDEVVEQFSSLNELAPLHNPAGLIGYNAFKENLPHCKHAFVFDTAFHQTMPQESYIYALPIRYYNDYKIRRYGFHGTSHKYVSLRAAEILGKKPEDLKIVVCHLGNGSSISAVDGGKCVDTSMGLTPLEGLVMGTRSGDIDPTCIEFIAHKENLSLEQVMDIVNKKSGVLGISGVSSDFRDLDEAAKAGNKRADLALRVFAHSVVKYIGSFIAVMNGVDAIVFTAGIGENDDIIRSRIIEHFDYLDTTLDQKANKMHGEERIISTPDSKVKVICIPTNEELAICRDTVEIVTKKMVEDTVKDVLSNN